MAASAANAARIFLDLVAGHGRLLNALDHQGELLSDLGSIILPSSPSLASIIFMEVSNAMVRTNSCSSLPTSEVGPGQFGCPHLGDFASLSHAAACLFHPLGKAVEASAADLLFRRQARFQDKGVHLFRMSF